MFKVGNLPENPKSQHPDSFQSSRPKKYTQNPQNPQATILETRTPNPKTLNPAALDPKTLKEPFFESTAVAHISQGRDGVGVQGVGVSLGRRFWSWFGLSGFRALQSRVLGVEGSKRFRVYPTRARGGGHRQNGS